MKQEPTRSSGAHYGTIVTSDGRGDMECVTSVSLLCRFRAVAQIQT